MLLSQGVHRKCIHETMEYISYRKPADRKTFEKSQFITNLLGETTKINFYDSWEKPFPSHIYIPREVTCEYDKRLRRFVEISISFLPVLE